MLDLQPWQWFVAVLATIAVGASKTALPGLTIAVVPLTAAAFGGKASVGLMLPWLIMADCCVLWWYRHRADWQSLRSVLPWLFPGIALGGVLLWWIDRVPGSDRSATDWFQPLIGVIIIIMLLVIVLRRLAQRSTSQQPPSQQSYVSMSQAGVVGTGIAAGCATTIANAAGPIMAIYLASYRLDKEVFVGTSAWLFLMLNLSKVPLFIGLTMFDVTGTELFTDESLLLNLVLTPGIIVGAVVGRWLLPKLPQGLFEGWVLTIAGIAAIRLLLSPWW